MKKITIYKGYDYISDEELSAWRTDKAKAIEESLKTILRHRDCYEELYEDYLEDFEEDEENEKPLSFKDYFKEWLEEEDVQEDIFILEETLYID